MKTGTVIHATFRTYDLVNAFREELKERHFEAYQQVFIPTCGFSPIPSEAEGNDKHEYWDSEDAQRLLESLFDTLDECAPYGYYFGTHPGDGSDFGYWECEENE